MKTNTITLFNTVRRDALLRTSDSPQTLTEYFSRYHQTALTQEQAAPVYKALETLRSKLAAKKLQTK